MIYRHPISPKGAQPTPKVHNNAPPTADIAAVATPTQANPHRGHTNVYPQRGSHPPTPPQQHPTHVESTLQRTLDAGCSAAGARRSSPAPAHHRTAPVHRTSAPHWSDAHPAPHNPAPHILRRTDRAHCTDQPYISACKRALHCAMYTVKRPDNLGAVRTITRHGELDKESSQSPDTAEPSRGKGQPGQSSASQAPGQPRPRLGQSQPKPRPEPVASQSSASPAET